MEINKSSHIYIMVKTHPELHKLLQPMMRKQAVTEDAVIKLQSSPIYSRVFHQALHVIQASSDDLRKVNLMLSHLDETVKLLQEVDYSRLTDGEHDDLMKHAKKLDEVDVALKEKDITEAVDFIPTVYSLLEKQNVFNQNYITKLSQVVQAFLKEISDKFDVEIDIGESLDIRDWSEFDSWSVRQENSERNKDLLAKLCKVREDVDDLEGFIKAIIAHEALICAKKSEKEDSVLKKIVKYIEKATIPEVKLEVVICPNHELRARMDKHYEKIVDGREKIKGFVDCTEESLSEDEVKHLKTLSTKENLMTGVGFGDYDDE